MGRTFSWLSLEEAIFCRGRVLFLRHLHFFSRPVFRLDEEGPEFFNPFLFSIPAPQDALSIKSQDSPDFSEHFRGSASFLDPFYRSKCFREFPFIFLCFQGFSLLLSFFSFLIPPKSKK